MILLKTIIGSLAANVNEITFTDSLINSNSIIEVYYDNNDVYTLETWQRENTIGIVTNDHDFPVSVKVLINNVVTFEPYDDSQVLSQLSSLNDRVTITENAISSLQTDKQDVLIPGDNISIVNNVISVDITYAEQGEY